ncbi:MAG: hypothetical protein ACR2QK_11980, partial [Acidimicrobiales bacterium]
QPSLDDCGFIRDADYDEMVGDSRFDRDRLFPAVIAYRGEVYDGVQVQVRGGDWARDNTRSRASTSRCQMAFCSTHLTCSTIRSTSLQCRPNGSTKPRVGPTHRGSYSRNRVSRPFRLHFASVDRNGEFYGLYRVSEKLDVRWRDSHGWSDANFFKATGGWTAEDGFDRKEGDDSDTTLDEVRAVLDRPRVTRTAAFYDTFDIFECTGLDFIEPTCVGDPVLDALWAIPEFQDAVYTRIRSILETTLVPGLIENRHRDLLEAIGSEVLEGDGRSWSQGGRHRCLANGARCQPGKWKTEYLHCNGHFQYSTD